MSGGEVVGMLFAPIHSDSHSTILSCRFPQPQLPALHLLPQVLGDTVALTFVAYAISVSLAMIYAEKHHYVIDPNQVCVQPGQLGSPRGGVVESGHLQPQMLPQVVCQAHLPSLMT